MSEKNKGQQGAAASAKPNKGQDEKTHTIQGPDGATVEVTQREFREVYKDQGFKRVGEDGEVIEEEEVEEVEDVVPPA